MPSVAKDLESAQSSRLSSDRSRGLKEVWEEKIRTLCGALVDEFFKFAEVVIIYGG